MNSAGPSFTYGCSSESLSVPGQPSLRSNDSALPFLPAVVQVGPESVPLLAEPELSASDVPERDHYAEFLDAVLVFLRGYDRTPLGMGDGEGDERARRRPRLQGDGLGQGDQFPRLGEA